jgi:glycosyltransferase involved in cell wall biosynthesis
LEQALAGAPERARLHIVYVDLPRRRTGAPWDPFSSPNQRLDYLLWLVLALRAARRLQREQPFDLVWHLTFANIWMGTVGALVGAPFVCGPVGGGVAPPWRLAIALGPRVAIAEVARAVARTAGRFLNPLARSTWRGARLILVQNPETRHWLPAGARDRAVVLPNATIEMPVGDRPPRLPGPPTLMFAGRLVAWKGPSLVIGTLALLPGWRLLVCGAGAAEPGLRQQVETLGLGDRVEFAGWLPHAEVAAAMRERADVFILPSIRDEGSWVVAEARAAGVPVVCLDRGGPPVLGGSGVAVGSVRGTTRRLAREVLRAHERGSVTLPGAMPVESLTVEGHRATLVRLLQARGLVALPDDTVGT